MPLYIGDYLADTRHLTTEEHGAYLLLLMTYWRIGGPLPDDDVKLSRMAGLTLKRWLGMRKTIIEFFRAGEGQLVSTRAQREIDNSKKRSEVARAKAMKRHGTDDAAASAQQCTDDEERVKNGQSPYTRPRASPSPSPLSPLSEESPLPPADPANAVIRSLDETISEIFGAEQARPYPHATDRVIANRMLEAGATPELLAGVFRAICQRMKSQGRRRPDNLKFFDGPVSDALAESARPARKEPDPLPSAGQHMDHEYFRWKARIEGWKMKRLWDADWGPSPVQPGCLAPPELIKEFGLEKAA